MALKTSNKNRKKVETLHTIKEITMEDVEAYKEAEKISGVEGWVSQDAIPYQTLNPKQVKWVIGAVVVAIVALLII